MNVTKEKAGENRENLLIQAERLFREHVPLIAASAPAFEFGNPEFCTFPDMFRYDIQVLLST